MFVDGWIHANVGSSFQWRAELLHEGVPTEKSKGWGLPINFRNFTPKAWQREVFVKPRVLCCRRVPMSPGSLRRATAICSVPFFYYDLIYWNLGLYDEKLMELNKSFTVMTFRLDFRLCYSWIGLIVQRCFAWISVREYQNCSPLLTAARVMSRQLLVVAGSRHRLRFAKRVAQVYVPLVKTLRNPSEYV